MAVIDVVKYDGTPDVFAWKFPNEELSTWTQLIVNESEEAILFKGGQALDLFTSGRHTLETANIPFLNKIINLPFGGKSPFTAEIWYINKVNSLDIKWGTATPIQLQDPKYKVFIPLRSYGQFGIAIEDSRKFLVKLVGTLPFFDKESIINYFKGLYLTRVKDTISSFLLNKQISMLEINAYLDEISDYLKDKMTPAFAEYGIKLVTFFVNDINVPEDDPAVVKLKEALAKRAEMDIVGYSYQQERSFDTLEGAATNPGSGSANMMGVGLGLGLGSGLGGAMGGAMGGIASVINTAPQASGSEQKHCPGCNAVIESNSKFCSECGMAQQRVCPGCNVTLSGNPKFCPECGQKL